MSTNQQAPSSLYTRLDGYFHFTREGSSLRTEALAGITTFLTMAYIIFVQPTVLSGAMFGQDTGMDFGAIMTATCIAAAIATLMMGVYARFPVALAPGMGANFFLVLTVIPAAAAAGYGQGWEVGLGIIFVSGALFLVITVAGIREKIMHAFSPDLKNGIAVGIGLFIAFVGLQNTNLIVKHPGTTVSLNPHFASPDLLIFFAGLIVTAALHVRRVRGSILIGILFSTMLAVILQLVLPLLPDAIAKDPLITESMLMTRFQLADGVISAPPSIWPTLGKMDVIGALSTSMLPFIII
ncbi:MAG: NCS2 family permease, partial [Leptospiraceae bacterium]|nr:NCS2 family permease [Leptospiraceae bacterium]